MGKKILYIYGGLYSPNGMSAMISQKVNYLAEHTDNELYIVLTEHPEKPRYYQLSDKVVCKSLVINFDDMDTMPLHKKLYHYFIKQRKFKRLLTDYMMELRPDVTVSITRREINFINQIQDGSKKIAEIHFARTFYRQFNKKFLPKFVNQWISRVWMNGLLKNLKQLDRFVVLTHEDSQNWPELNNLVVIPNFVSSMPVRKSDGTAKRVVAAGRYSYQKGFDMLIDAWTIVSPKHPDWQLDIYGAGDFMYYQQLADERRISDTLHCNPAVKDIFDIFADCSIYALSSRYEGFGLVTIEAMGAGLPVVSFACPCGPRDIINEGVNGLLVENGNIQQFADKLCYMIEHEEERRTMGKNAVSAVLAYQKDTVMQKWIELFNSL